MHNLGQDQDRETGFKDWVQGWYYYKGLYQICINMQCSRFCACA